MTLKWNQETSEPTSFKSKYSTDTNGTKQLQNPFFSNKNVLQIQHFTFICSLDNKKMAKITLDMTNRMPKIPHLSNQKDT